MEMLDGTRTRSDLAAELKPFIERVDDLNEKEKRDLVRDLPGWIDESITELARLGVFES